MNMFMPRSVRFAQNHSAHTPVCHARVIPAALPANDYRALRGTLNES